MQRPAQRHAAESRLDRVDFRTTIDEKPRHVLGAGHCRGVQRAEIVLAAHIGRHAEVEEQAGDIRTPLLRGLDQRRRVVEKFGMRVRKAPHALRVGVAHAARNAS